MVEKELDRITFLYDKVWQRLEDFKEIVGKEPKFELDSREWEVWVEEYTECWLDLVDWCGYGANEILDIAEKYFKQSELPEGLYNWADGMIERGLERRYKRDEEKKKLVEYVEMFLSDVEKVLRMLKGRDRDKFESVIFGNVDMVLDSMAQKYFQMGIEDYLNWAKLTEDELKFIFQGLDDLEKRRRAAKLGRKWFKTREWKKIDRQISVDIGGLKNVRGFVWSKAYDRLAKAWLDGWVSEAIYRAEWLFGE